MNNNEPYLIYIGKEKGFLFGVPARNLTYEETQIAGEGRLLTSGLYRLAKPKLYTRKVKKETEDEVNNG